MKPEVAAALAKQGEARAEQFNALARSYCASGDAAGLRDLIAVSVFENAPEFNVATARKVLSTIAEALKTSSNGGELAPVLDELLRSLQPRIASFEEQDVALRDVFSTILTAMEDYSGAARVLAGIDLRSQRFTDADRAERLVSIAVLFLEDGQAVDAEAFVNRASQVITEAKDQVLQSRYKVCYARMLDAKRKFIEASARYYELSLISMIGDSLVDEADLVSLLSKSLICVILANAGPQKSRMLGQLIKDERTRDVNGGKYYTVLEKMYSDKILKRAELKPVEEVLERHQKATLADGSSPLERAMIEHNVVAASRVYDNISFTGLGQLLEIEPAAAERLVSKMVSEGRLQGSIDQIEGILTFSSDASLRKGHVATGEAGKLFTTSISEDFDAQIDHFCDSVNALVDKIVAKHPQLAPE